MGVQPSPNKVCRICKQDVSRVARVKDAQGHYYCQPCHDEAARKLKAGEPVVPKARQPNAQFFRIPRWWIHQSVVHMHDRCIFRRLSRPSMLCASRFCEEALAYWSVGW